MWVWTRYNHKLIVYFFFFYRFIKQKKKILTDFYYSSTEDLEDMKQKRAELQKQIDLEEEEKQNLEREMKNLTNKLLLVNDRLGKKKNVHNEYDRIIAETEASFTKVNYF